MKNKQSLSGVVMFDFENKCRIFEDGTIIMDNEEKERKEAQEKAQKYGLTFFVYVASPYYSVVVVQDAGSRGYSEKGWSVCPEGSERKATEEEIDLWEALSKLENKCNELVEECKSSFPEGVSSTTLEKILKDM